MDCSGDLMWWLFTRKLLFNENSGKKKLLFAFTGGFITRGSLLVFFPSCVTLFIKNALEKHGTVESSRWFTSSGNIQKTLKHVFKKSE